MPEENGITYLRDTGIKCKPRILYSAKLTFNYKRHKTTVINMQGLREYCSQESREGRVLDNQND